MTLPETELTDRRDERLQEFEHDLRNFLGVIVTYSDLLSRGAIDQRLSDGLGAIHESATLALELAGRFRDEAMLNDAASRASNPSSQNAHAVHGRTTARRGPGPVAPRRPPAPSL